MLKIIKLLRIFENLRYIRYSSSGRYQFKIKQAVYYPKRDLSEEEDFKNAFTVTENVQKPMKEPLPSIDYYKILGVGKLATTQQIKGAYYELAKKFHPDRTHTPQETKSFQQISEAYHVLSDENNRMEYDRYGMVRNTQPYLNTITIGDSTVNIEKKRPMLLKMSKEEVVTPEKEDKRVALKDIAQMTGKNEITLDMKFLQAVQGCTEYVDVKAMVKCPRCNGAAKLGSQAHIKFCSKCGGTGQCRVKTDTAIEYKVCDGCGGNRYTSKNTCKICENRGFIVQRRKVELNIPPGSGNGDILPITNPLNNQIVRVRLNVDKSSYFKRDGCNINTDKYLTISQAVLGGKFKIRGLYEDLEVNLSPGVESHTTHCFKGKGISSQASLQGDHTVTFKIRIPKNLTTKQRQLMLALARTEDPTFDGQ